MKKIIRSVRYSGHQLLGSHEFLFPILRLKTHLREPDSDVHFITHHHNVCITGPPRSANTFATHVFRLWNPNWLIAHHIHLPIQALSAAKWNIPCVVLLRNPADTIASLLAVGNLNISSVIFGYINFYNRIVKVRSRVIVWKFQDVINNPHFIVSRMNQKYGTNFNGAPLTELQKKEIFSTIKNSPTRKEKLMIPIPNSSKSDKKRAIMQSVINHSFFPRAISVYNDWLRFSNLEK